MTVRSFRIIALQTILQHSQPLHPVSEKPTSRPSNKTTSGRLIVDNLDRITEGLTPEDIADLERISREIRQLT